MATSLDVQARHDVHYAGLAGQVGGVVLCVPVVVGAGAVLAGYEYAYDHVSLGMGVGGVDGNCKMQTRVWRLEKTHPQQ